MFNKILFVLTIFALVSGDEDILLCKSLNLNLSVFYYEFEVLAGYYIFTVEKAENGKNYIFLSNLSTIFSNSSRYYFENGFLENPDFHFSQPFELIQYQSKPAFLISNDTVDIKFWFHIDKDLFFIPLYLVVDQGSISFQSGETIEKSSLEEYLPWNRTDTVNENVKTVIEQKCISYEIASRPETTIDCKKFTITSHIYNIKNNNNLVATVSSKLNFNGDSMDIKNDFSSTSKTKFAVNVNFYYSTNYTHGSSIFSIPMTGNRKYIFMLNFEINDLGFVSEYLGKFIKRDSNFLMEEGVAFPDQFSCLSLKRLLRGSLELQLESYMCCFTV